MTETRFFGAYEWKSAGIAAFLAFVVFRASLAPTVTLEHSGALVVAADHLGVGRVPGYPVSGILVLEELVRPVVDRLLMREREAGESKLSGNIFVESFVRATTMGAKRRGSQLKAWIGELRKPTRRH